MSDDDKSRGLPLILGGELVFKRLRAWALDHGGAWVLEHGGIEEREERLRTWAARGIPGETLSLSFPEVCALLFERDLATAGAAAGVEVQARLERVYAAHRARGEKAVTREVEAQLGVPPAGKGRKLTAGPVGATVAYLLELWRPERKQRPERKPSEVTTEMMRDAIDKIARDGPWREFPSPSEKCRTFLYAHAIRVMKRDRGGELERAVKARFARLVHKGIEMTPDLKSNPELRKRAEARARLRTKDAAARWLDWFIATPLPLAHQGKAAFDRSPA